MSESLIVSASGIRGVVGRGLTPEIAARYGAAFGAHLLSDGRPASGGFVLVGRDSRASGHLMVDAVCAGLRAVGLETRDLGIVATPTGLLAVGAAEAARGGLLVTASHNPAEWNGLKLVAAGGAFLTPEAGRDVQRRFEAPIEYAAWDRVGGRGSWDGANEYHLARILDLPLIDVARIRERRFKVGLDCVHGAGGLIMPPLLERLGCEVAGIGLEADGRFPRPPEPVPENLGLLGELVRNEGADVGLAVDPDVDRLALVDETGQPVGEDWTLTLAVELVAARQPGPVVTNLSSSRSIEDAATKAGVPFHRAPVGEANVVARMREVGATIGGEGNGGVIYPALHLTRDAPLAAALILQLLAERPRRLSEILASRPGYWIVKRKMDRGGLAVAELLEALARAAPAEAERDRQDGIRLAWPDGSWVHVRPSGTEPIVRIVAEAPQERSARELADWVESQLRT